MSRRQFTFRPGSNNAEHHRAWQALQAVPEGQRTSFLVQAILAQAEREELESALRWVLREELQNIAIAPAGENKEPKPAVAPQMTDFLSGFMSQ